jgi:hypothetical protein
VPPIACMGASLGRPPTTMVLIPAWRVRNSAKMEQAGFISCGALHKRKDLPEAQIPSVRRMMFSAANGWGRSGWPAYPYGIMKSVVSSYKVLFSGVVLRAVKLSPSFMLGG